MPIRRVIPKRDLAAVLAVAAGLAAAGCGTGAPDLAQQPARPVPATGPASAGSPAVASSSPATGWTAPLTGLPAASAGAAGRPAVAVPVAGPDPQGLSAADVVFEEITSPVRYIAVFQSDEAGPAGPVAATRPTDGQALSVLHPLLGYDGGTPSFIRVLDQTKVVDVGYAGHPSLYHFGAAGATVSPAEVGAAAPGTAPPQLFTYRGTGVAGAASFASTGSWRTSALRVTAPGLGTQVWTFSPRTGRWTDAAGGPAVQVANLVVQAVPYKTVNLSTRYGLTTASARVIGAGPALVLSAATGAAGAAGGVAVHATWSKPGIADITNYLDPHGVPVGLQPGSTWVILAPPGTRITTTPGRP